MLNWLARYAAVIAELDLGPDGDLRESVLDVGCGPHGLSVVAPHATFAGVDIDFGGRPLAQGMVGFRSRPGPLPFEDASFDTVICLDVLEHVPPLERAGFVAELARVSARRTFLACPSEAGVWVESLLRNAFTAGGAPLPDWLAEHDEHGLPTEAEIASWASGLEGFRPRELALTNGLVAGLTVLADMLPELADRAAREWERDRERWVELLSHARFGETYRGGYVLERSVPRAAAVTAESLAGTAGSAALRCPSCGRASLTREGPALLCGSCGCTAQRDRSGAWDLSGRPRAAVARPVAAMPLAAAVSSAAAPRPSSLVLRPASWADPLAWLPALSSYIALVPPDGPSTTLYLDARDADLDPLTLRSLVGFACEQVAGDAPFAAVALLEDGVVLPDGAEPVGDEEALVERLGLSPSRVPEEPGAIISHARWAKGLVDALRAEADRQVLARRTVDLSGEPLVTVRIPTWGATEPLIERAIASALHQDWRNLEVLVCSDGPQPHARQAVGAVGDRRVRYLEVEERPQYPTRRESFWQTAGTWAVNRLLDEARGAVIAPLDHDDAFTHTHVRRLVAELRAGADFAYGQAMTEYPDGDWRLLGSAPLAYGEIVHATVAYTSRLGHMRYDPHAWLLGEPGDWNMWRRVQATGAVVCHVPEPVAVHFKERTSIAGQQRTLAEDASEMAADVLRTSAAVLLTVRRAAPISDTAPVTLRAA
jgi:SAM-dependent methyltransferase